MLNQNGDNYFDDPPDVVSVMPSGDDYVVILELTGAVEPPDGASLKATLCQAEPDRLFDPDITVTICQEGNCSGYVAVVAIYLTPSDINP